MSTVLNAGERSQFVLQAGVWFTVSGTCEVFIDRTFTVKRQKISAAEQKIGPFRGDANVAIVATDSTTWEIASGVGVVLDAAGNIAFTADQVGDLGDIGGTGGAALIGANDASAGAKYTTLQGFLTYLLASLGAGIVGFLQSGTGAVARWVLDKLRESVSVEDFGAATTNTAAQNLAAIQACFTAHPGKRINIHANYTVSAVLNVTGDDTEIVFAGTGGLTYTVATDKLLNVTGARVKVRGGTINAPATFDGTNAEPTYGTIWVTADGFFLDGTRFVNVPKSAIVFKNVNDGSAVNFVIEGNFPEGDYTGTNVGHAGIWIDPNSTGSQGCFVICPRSIKGCVQGVLMSNYGAASYAQSLTVTGGVMESIWNHGVYAAGDGNGHVVSGVSFARAGSPIAMTGKNHTVTGCTIQTQSTGAVADQPGISMREAIGCTVTGNTIKGDAATGAVIINFTAITGTTVSRNTCTGNVVDVTGGSAIAINMGSSAVATEVNDNVVVGNTLRGVGRVGIGQILVAPKTGETSRGNKVDSNVIVLRGESYGVQLVEQDGGSSANSNTVRLEYDAPGAVAIYAIALSSCKNTSVKNNSVHCTAAWGANVSLRAVLEAGAGTSKNQISDTTVAIDPTKVTVVAPFVGVSGSGSIFKEAGTGAPNLNAGVGSIWTRTDGGAGTSQYFKEVGTDAAGWVGK